MSFTAGQRIICTKPLTGGYGNEKFPVPGNTYTVKATQTLRQSQYLQLSEIINAPQLHHFGTDEMWFNASAFAPERTTSIEVFKAMLVSPVVRVGA
ncbi:hypothetical protein LJR231_003489 [Phyllobacterium sp. LjRoot231]|uniref:hypothetical protein n=1 Tax=Phyllobacterium sp. LjRoot231 TaxID=3342289 RepID=UPI003ECFFE4A